MENAVPDHDWTVIDRLPVQEREELRSDVADAESQIRKARKVLDRFRRYEQRRQRVFEGLGQAQPVFEKARRSRKSSGIDISQYARSMHNAFGPLQELLDDLSQFPRIKRLHGFDALKNEVRAVEEITANRNDFGESIDDIEGMISDLFDRAPRILNEAGREINNFLRSSEGIIQERRSFLDRLHQGIIGRAVKLQQTRKIA